jgi:hypothetical protein
LCFLLQLLREIPQHVRQNAAVLVVVEFLRRVDTATDAEHLHRSISGDRSYGQRGTRAHCIAHSVDCDRLEAGEPERLTRLTVRELAWNDAHANEIRSMNALEALGDHRPHAEEHRPLRRPVARRTGAVFLAGDDHERGAARLVRFTRLEERRWFGAVRRARPPSFQAGR